MQSIIDELGSAEFIRLRIGIGRSEDEKDDVVDFVLTPFSGNEKEVIEKAIRRAGDALDAIASDGLERAMNRFNG